MTDIAPNNPRIELLRQHYDVAWSVERQVEDSPALGRHLLAVEILKAIDECLLLNDRCDVLDIGSGPRPLEARMQKIAHRVLGCTLFDLVEKERLRIVTMDIAMLDKHSFRATQSIGRQHVTATSLQLPFQSGSFPIVCANMSFDMIGSQTTEYTDSLREVRRVMTPDGVFMANLHHGELYNALQQCYADSEDTAAKAYFSSTEDNPFFTDAGQIADTFAGGGLRLSSLAERKGDGDVWWQVEATAA